MSKRKEKNADVITPAQARRLNSRLQETPIAVIGMASVFADAKNLSQYWDNILERIDSIIDIPPSRWKIEDYYSPDKSAPDKTYCKRGAFIPELDFDPMEFGLPPNILEVTDIAQLLALVVARDVLDDAGIGEGSGYDRDKVGVVLGVGGGIKQIVPLTSRLQYPVLNRVLESCGVAEADRSVIIEKFKKAYIGWEENSFPGMLGNVIAGRIANRFDLGGTNCVVDAACAGSLAAMRMAVSDLLEYRSEVMISGGICCDNSPFMYMSFSKTPAFTTNETIRPFDEDSKGMMVGEGIGMVALKRLEDAERDGDRIYAVLKGIGTSSDGRFKSIYAPRPDGQAKALARAYLDAGYEPSTVGLIEAHGTGTLAGDAAEVSGLCKFFGPAGAEKYSIALGSVKSQIGHTKSAAGAAGFIKACLALHHKVLPATINVTRPSDTLHLEDSPFYINTETRPWVPRADGAPRRAGVSSFGFGGTNFHFALQEYKPRHEAAYRLNPVSQAVLFSGKDEAAVVAQVKEWQAKFEVKADDQPYVLNNLAQQCALKTPAASEARLGFVAATVEEAKAALEQALKQFSANPGKASWSTPAGLCYAAKGVDARGKVVALFSGQGSQYLNMGRELACNFPEMMDAVAGMDAEFLSAGLKPLSSRTYPVPVFSDQDRERQENELQLTQHAQPAIGTFSVGAYRVLGRAGFHADFAAGHSFGELTALWAAGVLDDANYRMLARARGQAMAAPDDKDFDAGTMIAVVGDPAKVAADIQGYEGISIANYNSTNQVVVAGVTKEVLRAMDDLKGKGYKVVRLPVSAAFHTPLVGHAQKPFAAAIEQAVFNKPEIPVFANGTGKPHSTKPADIKKVMKNHILESVRFNEEIENIYAAGGRVFVEFGPKNVLTKLVENILKGKDDVVAIAVNGNPKKSSDEQLRIAAVQMAVYGIALESVDPYAVAMPLAPRKLSPMALKLSAASYVSEKTRKAYETALNDGYRIQQAVAQAAAPQIVEKIVEKVVHVPVAAGAAAPATSTGAMVESLERSISHFCEHQKQLLDVHQQYMQGPADYARTVQQVLEAQSSAPELPESISRTLAMYHDFQSETLRVHEQYLNNQAHGLSELMGASTSAAPLVAQPVAIPSPPPAPVVAAVPVAAPVVAPVVAPAPVAVAPAPAPVVVAPVAAPVSSGVDLAQIQKVMMQVVADKTGYPTEMLELGMDMEADLGIDSIKRVEILGAVQDAIPNLPELNPEDLAELRTLGQIVEYMQKKAGSSAKVAVAAAVVAPAAALSAPAAGGVDLAQIQKVMMQVVADKTGYPTEMLELGMDMEADLGIDSIKRVEILGAVQDAIPNLPELNPEDLAELRTLGQIVEYMQKKAGGSAAPAPVVAPVAAPVSSGVDLAQIQKVMMQVVADKTGYPPEMLELGMDMEADLGIDSIKRVEILGAVQDAIPNLPELNPEDLAELRTLGQIVEYMQKKAGGSAAPAAKVQAAAAAILAPVKTAISTAVVDASTFARKLMAVVAEKTGYPVEMLELDMDMEADLGIDSIKRVEILGATQDSMPGLPEVEPEKLAEMRTLGQIVDVFAGMGGQGQVALAGGAPANAPVAAEKKSFEPAPSATVAIRSLPAPSPIAPAKGGNCLLVDDGSAEAVLLAEKLLEDGFQVTALTPAWVSSSVKKSFSKAVKRAQLESPVSDEKVKAAVAAAGSLDMVVCLHSAPAISGITYPENSSEGLKLAFLLAKHCQVKAASRARPAFVAVTRQGGKLGFGGSTNSDLVQGGLDGLVKTLAQEWPQVFCRLVDLADGVAAADAAAVLHAELFDAETSLHEVGCDGTSRMTLVAVPTDSYAQAQGNRITADSVFLVSGGAKGVTTHCVARIASEYRCKFILLGRSAFSASEPAWANGIADEAGLKKAAMQALSAAGEKPTPARVQQMVRPVLSDREIASALAAIRRVGGQAEYVSADVTNAKAVKESVAAVVKKLGKITGIIHGAGVLADKFIEQKTLEDFNAVYRTKMDGLVALLGCVDENQLQHLVLFSSAAGFYGNPGQSDYSIANEILNKTALRFKALHPSAQVLSFNWGPWDGGMVTPELKRMFTQRGVYIIPLDAGAELLLKEMAAAENRCPQILVGNEMSGSEGVSQEGTPAKKPEAGRVIRALHAANNPFLADHVIGGNRVLPTVCAIAVMAEAAESLYPGYHYQGLAGYRLFKGVVFDGNEPASYLIDLKLLEEKGGEIRVEAKVSSTVAGKTVFHYGATLVLGREHLAQPAFAGKRGNGNIKSAAAFYQNGTLFHGESLQGLTNLISCDGKGLQLACRVPSSAHAKQGDFPVGARNIFADDLVFQSLLVWVREQQGLGSLPSSTASWTLYREPAVGEEFLLQLAVVEDSSSKLLADVVLVDGSGRVLAEVRSAEVTKSATLNDLFLATGKRGA